MATSRPSSPARSSFHAERDVPNTVAPATLASWSAAVPTPLPTAWISNRSPRPRPSWVNSASCAVMNTSGTAPASSKLIPSGIGIASRSGTTTYSA